MPGKGGKLAMLSLGSPFDGEATCVLEGVERDARSVEASFISQTGSPLYVPWPVLISHDFGTH
jgi:hypothetical protein